MKLIELSQLFQDHMILQRDKNIYIQGTVLESLTLKISLDQVMQEYTLSKGPFLITFPSQSAARHKTLSFYCNQESTPSLQFEDVNIGDIWLAAGQSNMEYFMRYDAHWNETKQLPINSDIRMFNCPQIAFEGQKRNLPYSGFWFEQGDAAWNEFSAPGFYFANYLQPDLDVPVGIIGCNWGGTPACAWMDESYLAKDPLKIFLDEYDAEASKYSLEELKNLSTISWEYEDSYRHQLEWRAMMYGMTEAEQQQWMKEHQGDPILPMGPYHHYRPSGLYHTMLEKISPFSMKGVLWYQGCSDTGEGHACIYDKTLTAMIQCFRDTLKDASLPFLIVQLAPFGKWLECTNDGYALLRQKQDIVAKTVENVYMTSIMDLGMWEDIHPKEKREVGKRLALLAKGNVYGYPVLANSPELSHVEITDQSINIYCKHVGELLHSKGNPAENFEVDVNGKSLIIQQVALEGRMIKVCLADQNALSEGCVTVSYANKDYCVGNIWNDADLPLNPFVTSLPIPAL